MQAIFRHQQHEGRIVAYVDYLMLIRRTEECTTVVNKQLAALLQDANNPSDEALSRAM